MIDAIDAVEESLRNRKADNKLYPPGHPGHPSHHERIRREEEWALRLLRRLGQLRCEQLRIAEQLQLETWRNSSEGRRSRYVWETDPDLAFQIAMRRWRENGCPPREGLSAEDVEEAAEWGTFGVVIYWVISGGSRLIPFRNAVPIP